MYFSGKTMIMIWVHHNHDKIVLIHFPPPDIASTVYVVFARIRTIGNYMLGLQPTFDTEN